MVAGLLLVVAFWALNSRAYDGYFQDDELDNISWAPNVRLGAFALDVVKPVFDSSNFRPVGHGYFVAMARGVWLDFPPYMTPLFVAHLLNGLLLFLILRRLGIGAWAAMGGTAFFVLSGSAMDAYWKPMYVFDLFCTTFCLLTVLLWAQRRWVLSFMAYWLAYKAKELAVMLPFVLLAWEWWFGDAREGRKRFLRLAPFFVASLSFGVQGILLNPNKDNEYTFRFSFEALRKTVPFYAGRFLLLPLSGLLLAPLALVRDKRVWFGLTGTAAFVFTLLFLPGRLYEAYAYLPLACASIALAAAASKVNPVWGAVALVAWLPWNVKQLRAEQVEKLRRDDIAYAFVSRLERWVEAHPGLKTMVYEGAPGEYHDWGITAAWNLAHHTVGLNALFLDSDAARKALQTETVAYATWNREARLLVVQIHSPEAPK